MRGGLVGREPASASLRRAVDDADAGQGRLTLVAGEAGIGKTTLVADLAGYAGQRGMGVVWATCWDGDGAPPFWPWVQLLRGGDGQSPLGAAASDLARIDPELAGRLGVGSDPARSVRGPDARERFDLFDAVASALIRAAHARPLLVIVDDLQWADVPSLLLLTFVARRLAGAPLLIVGAYRDDEVQADDARRPLLAQMRGNADVVALTGLATADVERLMASVAGVRPAAGLAAEVSRRTDGNPFFVREVTQLLVSRGGLAEQVPGVGGIPEGVRQVVAQRLARLPQPCVSILTVAAVVGREAGSDLLIRVAGASADDGAARLAAAVRSRVLVPPAGPAGPYRFTHDLFRESLYEGLEPRARADLHLRIGQALRESQVRGSVIHSAELAHHFLLAAVGSAASAELAGQAVHYGMRAAEDATAQLAYEDAIGHIQRLVDGLDPAGLLDESARLELLLRRAEALRCAGEVPAARLDYDRAVDLAHRSPQPHQLARAALGVQALGVESGTSRAHCVGLLEDALDRLADEDSGLRARVLAALGRELFLTSVPERTRAARLSAAAVEAARRVGDDADLALCLLAAHDTSWLPGAAAHRRAIATEMGVVARRAGDRAFEAEACLLRASAALELGDPVALVDLDEFTRLGMAVGQPRYAYMVLTRRAARTIMDGRFAEAERLIAEAAALGETIGEPDTWNVQTRLLWQLRTAQGRRTETEALLRGVNLPQLHYWYGALLGLVLMESGQRSEALRAIGPAMHARPEQLAFPYVLLVQWAEMGEAAVAAGLREECQRYYDLMVPYAGTAAVTAAAVGFDGAVDHHLGVLATTLGRVDAAVRHLELAAALHERMSAWPWLARTRCELAAILIVRGAPADRDRTAALLGDARAAASEFGMAGLLQRIDQIRLPPANVFRRDGDDWHVAYAGRETRLHDVKGLADIAVLVSAPGQPVPALTLANGGVAPATAGFAADPVLDRQAQREYRARLAQLDSDIDAAHAAGDPVRASTLGDERAFLIRELSAAVGLGHRDRRLGDDRERARKAVAGRIKDALGRIQAVHPALAAHLAEAISTGNLCTYRPAQPTRWQS